MGKSKLFKAVVSVFLILTMLLGGTGCSKSRDANTLIYGSQDYTAINPALYEHGEINLLIFAGLTDTSLSV